jgi:hypothetical protein
LLHQVGDLFELNVKLRCQKVQLTINLQLVLRLRTNGAVNLLPLYALMTWTRTTLLLPCTADRPLPYSAVAVTTAQSLEQSPA